MNDTAEILDRAAALIEDHGLSQGTFWSPPDLNWEPGRPCCITGAIGVARGHTAPHTITAWEYDHDPAMQALAAHLGHPDNVFHVLRWNDDPLRTIPGVVRSLREAAARIRTGELEVTA